MQLDERTLRHIGELQQLSSETYTLTVAGSQVFLIRHQPAAIFVFARTLNGNVQLQFELPLLCPSEKDDRITASAQSIDSVYYYCSGSGRLRRVALVQSANVQDLAHLDGVSHLDVSLDGGTVLAASVDGRWQRYNSTSGKLLFSQQKVDCASMLDQPYAVNQAPIVLGTATVVLTESLPYSSSTLAFGYQLVSGQWVARLVRKHDLGKSPTFDFDLRFGVTIPCNVSSLAALKECLGRCPRTEWLTSTVYAVQTSDASVTVYDGGTKTTFPGQLILNGGDGLLLLSDKRDLLEATWLDIRVVATNVSNGTRLQLSSSRAIDPSPLNPTVSAVYWYSRLQIVFSDQLDSTIVTVDSLSSTTSLDLSKLAHDIYGLPYAALLPPNQAVVVQRHYIVPVSVSVGVVALLAIAYIVYARARRYRGYRQQYEDELLDDKAVVSPRAVG